MDTEKKLHAVFSKTLGSYNWANPSAKQWQLAICTTLGSLSVLFDEDAEPEIDDFLPTDILDLIERRIKAYLLYTRRDEELQKIATMRAHGNELNKAWLQTRVDAARRELTKYERWMAEVQAEIDEAAEAATA